MTTSSDKETTFIYSHTSLTKILKQKEIYIKQAKLLFKQVKGLCYIDNITKNVQTGEYTLIFKVLKKDRNTINKYHKMLEQSEVESNLEILKRLGIQE